MENNMAVTESRLLELQQRRIELKKDIEELLSQEMEFRRKMQENDRTISEHLNRIKEIDQILTK